MNSVTGMAVYLFSRSAAVLGSSNVSTPNARELDPVSPPSKAAAPEDGRTPLNRHTAAIVLRMMN